MWTETGKFVLGSEYYGLVGNYARESGTDLPTTIRQHALSGFLSFLKFHDDDQKWNYDEKSNVITALEDFHNIGRKRIQWRYVTAWWWYKVSFFK